MLPAKFFMIVLSTYLITVQSQGIFFPGSPSFATCRTTNNEVGTCKRLNRCRSVVKLLERGVTPVICGYDRGLPVICCPMRLAPVKGNTAAVTIVPVTSPQPLKSNTTSIIIAPEMSFQCGRFQSVGLSDTFSRRRRDALIEHQGVAGIFTSGLGEFPFMGRGDASRLRRALNQPTVVGGINAVKREWPWMALLGKGSSSTGFTWFCSAVLINRRWVLTAAHCFRNGAPDVVRLGEHDYSGTHDSSPHLDYTISKVVPHPDYKKDGPFASYHDLALIELAKDAQLSAWALPVCLPWGSAKRPSSGSTLTITGWGATEFGGSGSSILQVAQVQLFPTKTCNDSYAEGVENFNSQWPHGITDDTFLCAGNPSGGIDTCQGDSGGPIVKLNEEGRWVLEGIVSQGFGCGHEDYPGLYVPLTEHRYLAWIRNTAFD